MKKLNLSNLCEPPYPPTDTKVWEPYLVSVDYLKPDEPSESEELKTSEVTE